MSASPDVDALPAIPRDAEGPVFRAPWEAQAFALAIELHARGCFTWSEWTEALAAEIAAVRARAEADLGDRYYEHWLAALEKLACAKGLASPGELVSRRDAWDRAARATPHGRPIVLGADAAPGNGT